MKRNKLIYWISTGLFCAFLFLTGISYFTDPQFVSVYTHLGFPQYFRVELGIAKLIGAIVLLIPRIPATMKEWAYACFGITLISGAIAHIMSSDPAGYVVNVLFFLSVLIVSYVSWHKRQHFKGLGQKKFSSA